MKTLYLIRHGQASFGAEDYDKLSELGHLQSQKLGSYLREKSERFDSVFCGTLTRHQETLAGALTDHSPVINAEWNEFDHKAIIRHAMNTQGISREDVLSLDEKAMMVLFTQGMQAWLANEKSNQFPESWQDFQDRVQRAFNNCVEQTEKTGVVFTSGGPISCILGKIWNLSPDGILKLNWSLTNASVSKVIISRRGATVASFNEHHHLEKESSKLITYK